MFSGAIRPLPRPVYEALRDDGGVPPEVASWSHEDSESESAELRAVEGRGRRCGVAGTVVGALLTVSCISTAYHLRRGPGVRWSAGDRTAAPLLLAASLEEFSDLGDGVCLDHSGEMAASLEAPGAWITADVVPDGSSPDCAMRCRALDNCSGYVVRGKHQCGLVTEADFQPATADGTARSRCFRRQRFALNTRGIYDEPQPIPERIWSYWQGPTGASSNSSEREVQEALLRTCVESWRALNPGYEVNMLNDTTIWWWLRPTDLPRVFRSLSSSRKSDVVRLALLVRYGGFWLDPSVLLIHSLRQIAGKDPSQRVFFIVQRMPPRRPLDKSAASDNDYHVEKFFLAAPRQDPLMVRTYRCLMHEDEEFAVAPSPSSPSRRLGLPASEDLAVHTCLTEVIGKDAALMSWWRSDRVVFLNAMANLTGKATWFTGDVTEQVLGEVNFDVVDGVLEDLDLLRLTAGLRATLFADVSAQQLLCLPSTFTEVLSRLGLPEDPLCDSEPSTLDGMSFRTREA